MDTTQDSTITWAQQHARILLEPLGSRWRHTHAVAATAIDIAQHLELADATTLVAAAWLHDIGYAPSIARTGFHSLDGAHHLHDLGHARLAALVAHHTGAAHESRLRGLAAQHAAYGDEDSIVTAALAYSDLTNGPNGQPMTLDERRLDIERRYGPNSPVVESLHLAWPALTTAVVNVEHIRTRRPGTRSGRTS